MNAFFSMLNNLFNAVGTTARAVNEAAEAGERICRTANNAAAVYEAGTAKELKEKAKEADIHIDLLDRYKLKEEK